MKDSERWSDGMNRHSKSVQYTPVETKRASQLVFEQLRSHILRGVLKPGDELPSERQMMQQFRRSHPTIREALRMLESAGLIQVMPGNAAVIRTLEENPVEKPLDELFRYQEVTVHELIEFMAAIAPDLASLAALRRDHQDMEHIEHSLVKIMQVERIQLLHALPLYKALTLACKNHLIAVVWEALARMVAAAGQDAEPAEPFSVGFIRDSHRLLVAAVQNQNQSRAAELTALCWEAWSDMDVKLRIAQQSASTTELNDLNEQPFRPVQTEKASEAVYRQIREKILSGELLPGDKLPPERKLMELFGRSRPTIREALRMLESSHYVRTTPGSGTVVNPMTTQAAEQSLHDLLEMKRVNREELKELRNICETVVAAWAAQRRTAEDLQKLGEILKDVDSFVDHIEDSMAMGHRFNLLLAKSAHNKTAYVLTRAVSEVNYTLVQKSWESEKKQVSMADMVQHSRTIWQQHGRIFAAVKDQEPLLARRETIAHIEEANKPID